MYLSKYYSDEDKLLQEILGKLSLTVGVFLDGVLKFTTTGISLLMFANKMLLNNDSLLPPIFKTTQLLFL